MRLADGRARLGAGAPQGEGEVQLLHRARLAGELLGGERVVGRADDRAETPGQSAGVLGTAVPQLLEQLGRLRRSMLADARDVLAGRTAASAPTGPDTGQGGGRLGARRCEQQRFGVGLELAHPHRLLTLTSGCYSPPGDVTDSTDSPRQSKSMWITLKGA